MRKFFTAIIILLMFLGTSWADVIYTTSDGVLGSIDFTSSSDLEAPLTYYRSRITEPNLGAYWTGNGTNVILIDPYKTESGDRAYVFNPTDLDTPNASKDIAGVFGTELLDYARNGRSLFLTAGSEIFEVETEDFNVVNSFDYRRILSRDGYETEIVSLLVDNDYINTIIGSGTARKYVRFDGQLRTGVKYFVSADVSVDASCIAEINGTVLVGHKTGVSSLRTDGKFTQALSTDKAVVAICGDDDQRFYYAMMTSTGQSYSFTVTNVQNSSLRTKFSSREITSSYPYIKLMRDSDKNILIIMTAEAISLYDVKTARHLRDFSASELGGRPVGMILSSVSGYDNKSSSSGCNVNTGTLLLMLIAGISKWKKKTL